MQPKRPHIDGGEPNLLLDRPCFKRQRASSEGFESSTVSKRVGHNDLLTAKRNNDDLLARATRVLAVEAAALAALAELYRTNATAKGGLTQAADVITKAQAAGGKLITCGVGKSSYIAQKFTATCKSIGIRSSFLHAGEGVHGDLGDIQENDVLLFVSYSGKTPELLNLLPHIPESVQILAISSHTRTQECSLFVGRTNGILLPAPIPEREEITFGVSAPTTSTTVALAVADMLALTVAEELHGSQAMTREVFRRNHPGGAIGLHEQEAARRKRKFAKAAAFELPSPSMSGSDDG